MQHRTDSLAARNQGAAHGVVAPFKQPADGTTLSIGNRTYNHLLRALRWLDERGLALLTERRIALQHTTLSPGRIGDLARAALVPVHFEHGKISAKSVRKRHWATCDLAPGTS
ncbi:hypothetical protein Pth03_44610 [Planotetraspora thailandica]|uniref:Uncharacterized protein n=1 Tax=Planotetraspora thailandica TaxID=487172 RepID=A0A8J3V2D2_9ACTN|nr:hypothetical protein Pth03_44610 [Planotetraspora thailandica]